MLLWEKGYHHRRRHHHHHHFHHGHHCRRRHQHRPHRSYPCNQGLAQVIIIIFFARLRATILHRSGSLLSFASWQGVASRATMQSLIRLGHSSSVQDLDPVQAIVFASGREGMLTLEDLARMRCTSVPHHWALHAQFQLRVDEDVMPPLCDSSAEEDAGDESQSSDVSLDTLLASLRPRVPFNVLLESLTPRASTPDVPLPSFWRHTITTYRGVYHYQPRRMV